jgi:hypothetical protein
MPCFHTHWLVALGALNHVPDAFEYLRRGRDAYLTRAHEYRQACLQALRGHSVDKSLLGAQRKWEERLATEGANDITCFSAYMLGACGPDFWQLPSEPTSATIPSMASFHFDLGHYNRTHRQFEVSVAAVGGRKHHDIDARAQRSYFLGMATHLAADLVIHQLVNVTAGAYNLLEHSFWDNKWENEHGGAYGINIWNSHNKVEHFWDSYVRYRFLGDHGPFWSDSQILGHGDSHTTIAPYGLPTVEGLAKAAGTDAWQYLRDPKVRYAIEKPIMFPWVFCDSVHTGDVKPFVYRIVVDKDRGAYPSDELTDHLLKEARKESRHDQMTGIGGGRNEGNKLMFFCSKQNLDDKPTSFNFLTFRVCPDVENTKAYGRSAFYDIHALEPFVHRGVDVATKFFEALATAYISGKVEDLGVLRRFWNLDTGLGLRIKNVASATSYDRITELEFVHIFDEVGCGPPAYVRREPYRDGKPLKKFDFTPARAFKTYLPEQPFSDLQSIEESDLNYYLDRIEVSSANDMLHGNATKQSTVLTSTIKNPNVFTMREVRQRLDLRFTVGIADLTYSSNGQYGEPLAMFFMGDKTKRPKKAWDEETAKWLKKETAVLDYAITPADTDGGLQFFTTRLLVNTEKETADEANAHPRKLAKGTWNNVVPYNLHAGDYGRNFAIGTGRKHVLHPTSAGSGQFNPFTCYSVYENLSPTEHVFFTLYPFVKEDGAYFDMFSKTMVQQAQFNEILKISGCGTVKIVLVYERDLLEGAVLREAWVDHLKMPIEG